MGGGDRFQWNGWKTHVFGETLKLSEVSGGDPKLSLTKLYGSEDEEESRGRVGVGDEAEVRRVELKGGGALTLIKPFLYS